MTSLPRTSEPGHTKAVCRKSYIHPVVIDAYFEGTTVTVQAPRHRRSAGGHRLAPEERAVATFLSARVLLTPKKRLA